MYELRSAPSPTDPFEETCVPGDRQSLRNGEATR